MSNPNFNGSTDKNVVHGRNVNGYMVSLSKQFEIELDAKKSSIKEKVLDYTTDDAGNIDCFLDIFGEYVLFNRDKQSFYYWTGRLWREDKEKRIQLWVQIAMRARRDYTRKMLKKNCGIKNNDALKSHIQKCCNQHDIRAVIEGIKSHVYCEDSKFDTKRHLLNVLNGTIDLRKGELQKHSRKDFITMMIPFQYDKSSKSDHFEQFLQDTFQEERMIKYMQSELGYCLTGETKEQTVDFYYGSGANGKSTLLALVRYIMHDYAAVIPARVITSFEKTGAATSEIAQLPHKRLVCCSELNSNDTLNEGKIKIEFETIALLKFHANFFIRLAIILFGF
ncbi:MAG: phage/plasmid primase, P4 family, partial [Bacillota bacterium]|nr:phage/plasmid primase, P4 family [Bacillota bacterium]